MIFAALILILTTLLSLFFIYKKNPAFWAFVIFFQHIPLIIFYKLGSEIIGYSYYVFLIILYLFRSPKIKINKSKFGNPIIVSIYIILFMFFVHYVIVGIDISNFKGYDTVHNYLLLNIPIIIISLLFIPVNDQSYEKILFGIIIYGVIFLLTVLFVTGLAEVGIPDRNMFRENFRISALHVAKIGGVIIIASAINLINNKKGVTINYISLFAILLSSMLILISGSRAPFIFLIVVLFFYFISSSYRFEKKFKLLFSLLIFLFLGAIIITSFDLPIISRLQALENYNETLRYTRIGISFDLFKDFGMGIFGLGPYGFGYLTGLQYPHNYIFELIIDYGLFGFISLLLLVSFGFYYSYILVNIKKVNSISFIAILFIYLFLSALTSGDIVAAGHMHFTGILLANIYIYLKTVNRSRY